MIQHFQFCVYPTRIESKDLKSYLNNSLFKIAKKRSTVSVHCHMNEKNEMWHIHTIKYDAAFKRKEILTLTTTWMNLKDTMLS